MGAVVIGIVGLTVLAAVTTPPQEPVALPGRFPSRSPSAKTCIRLNCTQCHGPEGEGGVIQGVTGWTGSDEALHSQDEMYTRTDETLADIIAFGSLTWHAAFRAGLRRRAVPHPDRSDCHLHAVHPGMTARFSRPAPAGRRHPGRQTGEVPSYDVHIGPWSRTTAFPATRPGKVNNNYLLGSYADMRTPATTPRCSPPVIRRACYLS